MPRRSVNNSRKMSTYPVKRLSTTSGKEQKTVNQHQEKTKLRSALAVAALTSSRLLALGIAGASSALRSLLQRCSVAVIKRVLLYLRNTSIFIYKYRVYFGLSWNLFLNCNAATVQQVQKKIEKFLPSHSRTAMAPSYLCSVKTGEKQRAS